MSDLSRLVSYVLSTPWAILPEYGAVVQQVLARRAAGGRLEAPELEALEAARAARPARVSGGAAPGVFVLPVVGVIAHRMELVSDISAPGVSPAMLGRAFDEALADPNVGGIVLDVDSPGGSVFGIQELATRIRQARGTKPIVAVANAVAASAAYWIASAADELVVTPSGQVGAIGVYSMHEDLSKFLEREGVAVTLIAAGKYKTEGNPFGPLAADAVQNWQRHVDAYMDMFAGAVARGRGVPVDEVRSSFGEGRLVLARDAVGRRMADRVGTLDEEVDRMATAIRGGGSARAAAASGAAPAIDAGGDAGGPAFVVDPAIPVAARTPAGDRDRRRRRTALEALQ